MAKSSLSGLLAPMFLDVVLNLDVLLHFLVVTLRFCEAVKFWLGKFTLLFVLDICNGLVHLLIFKNIEELFFELLAFRGNDSHSVLGVPVRNWT
jgi:hypothetical protein